MAYTTIDNPGIYFNTITYAGNGDATRTITGAGFQPDLIINKNRSSTNAHFVWDAVRGNNKAIQTNDIVAESDVTSDFGSGGMGSAASDGFNIVSGTSNSSNVNNSGNNFVAWCWKANGSGSSNTEGNTDTTISANTTSGFSIIDGCDSLNDDDTFGHGLESAPNMVWLKRLDDVSGWRVFYTGITSGSTLALNGTGAVASDNDCIKSVSSTLVTIKGSGTGGSEGSGQNVAYAWHSVQGFSKIGTYSTNNNANGPYIFTGFSPAFVMLKVVAGNTGGWDIWDNKRGFNPNEEVLQANANSAEASNDAIDLLSNGFKIRNTSGNVNGSGDTIFYMGFAEARFVNSNGVPCNAR